MPEVLEDGETSLEVVEVLDRITEEVIEEEDAEHDELYIINNQYFKLVSDRDGAGGTFQQ